MKCARLSAPIPKLNGNFHAASLQEGFAMKQSRCNRDLQKVN